MKKLTLYLQLLILLSFIFYAQFHHLNKLPLRVWDEARLAANACEMAKSGNWLVPTVDGKPDLWNTKPPLMIWSQAILIKIKGFSETAVRLPSAICAAITTLLIAFFVYKTTGDGWTALLAGIALSTSIGYIGMHGTRAGEYDSMLTLFTTCYLLAFFMYTENTGSSRNKYLLLFFIALTGAVLTKSVAGLLFTPLLFIYALLRKQVISSLTNKYFYAGAALFIVCVAGYYLLREHYNPGYLNAVSDNELGGRYNGTNEAHTGSWHYYLDYLRTEHNTVWFWILPVSLFVVWFVTDNKLKRAFLFLLITVVGFLVIISLSKTKLYWYELPVYPLLACIIAITVMQVANIVSKINYVNRDYAIILLIVFLSSWPAYETYNYIKWQMDDLSADNFYAMSYYLRNGLTGQRDLSKTKYLYQGYSIQWRLYGNKLKEKGIGFDEIESPKNIALGNKVIINQPETQKLIEQNFDYTLVEDFYGVKSYKITGLKNSN